MKVVHINRDAMRKEKKKIDLVQMLAAKWKRLDKARVERLIKKEQQKLYDHL
jgi:hypothetical protein